MNPEPTEYEIELAYFSHPLAIADDGVTCTLILERTLVACRACPEGVREVFRPRKGMRLKQSVRVPWDSLVKAVADGLVVYHPGGPVPEKGMGEELKVTQAKDHLIAGKNRVQDDDRTVWFRVWAERDPQDSSVGKLQIWAERSLKAPAGSRSEKIMRRNRAGRLHRTYMSLREITDELERVTGKRPADRAVKRLVLGSKPKGIAPVLPHATIDVPTNIVTDAIVRSPYASRGDYGYRVKRSDFEEYLVSEYGVDIEEHHRWLRGEA